MSVITALKQADIFYELTNTQLELIGSICKEKIYQAGDIVFEENTLGSELYIIADGSVEIQVSPSVGEGTPQTIAILRRGQSFGEVSLVDEGIRSARARCAEENTNLLVIPREKIMLLCDTYPQLGYRLMRNLAADLAMKIRNTNLEVREKLTWAAKPPR